MKQIITCGLPLPIQRLYIKRLKHMIWRYEHENFCGHCPICRNLGIKVPRIEAFKWFRDQDIWWKVCKFCKENVNAYRCPCDCLGPKKALKRAKDFIERFEAEDGGKGC